MASPDRVVLDGAQRAPSRLKADRGEGGPGRSDAAIAGALDIHPETVVHVRRQFVSECPGPTLERTCPDRVSAQGCDGRWKVDWVALACSVSPAGEAR